MNERVLAGIESAETKRIRPPKKAVRLNINLPDRHFLDAIKAEAAVRGMSVNSFMRAMIRGYFGAA